MKTVGFLSTALLCVMMGMLLNFKNNMFLFILYWGITISIVIALIINIRKKRWKQTICLLSSAALLSLFFYFSGIRIPPMFKEVLDHHSSSISESKRADVYVCEYKLCPNSMGIRIKDAFLEHMHTYVNDYSRKYSINKNGYDFIIILANEEELKKKGYDEKWTIERYGSNRIVIPKEIEDTITLYLREKKTGNCFDSIDFIKISAIQETR